MSNIQIESLLNKIDVDAQQVLEKSLQMALKTERINLFQFLHLLYQLFLSQEVVDAIKQYSSCDLSVLTSQLENAINKQAVVKDPAPSLSSQVMDILSESWMFSSLDCNIESVSSFSIFLTILSDPLLRQYIFGILPSMRNIDVKLLREEYKQSIHADLQQQHNTGSSSNAAISTNMLDKYAINLTKKAVQSKIDPIIGREEEIQKVIEILLRRRQNNPILTGEPGVGKTACVEGLALKIATGCVPSPLKNSQLYALDLALLQAGAGIKGEVEKRLKKLLKEIESSPLPIILFIDEAHNLVSSSQSQGVSSDIANILKPALARGQLRTIAATTWSEYKKYFESDAALVRRFQIVTINEPSTDQAMNMLRCLKSSLVSHHGIKIMEEAIEAAVTLSDRYISERKLPDKALSLLDTACAAAKAAYDGSIYEVAALKEQIASKRLLLDSDLDGLYGAAHKKRHDDVSKDIQELDVKLDSLNKQYKQELDAIQQVQSFESDSSKKLSKAQLSQKKKLMKQLDSLQKNNRLIPCNVDKNMIAKILSGWVGIPVETLLKRSEEKIRNIIVLLLLLFLLYILCYYYYYYYYYI